MVWCNQEISGYLDRGVAVCLHVVCYPGMYLGWSGELGNPELLGQRYGCVPACFRLSQDVPGMVWCNQGIPGYLDRGMAVCLHVVCYPGIYLGWSGVTRESRDTWTEVQLCVCMLQVIPGCTWDGLGDQGIPGYLDRGMAVCVCMLQLCYPRMDSGVTRESWDTWTEVSMAVCLHAVCYPGMYVGWSGVTRESWDTSTEVWLCVCVLYVIPGCTWDGLV